MPELPGMILIGVVFVFWLVYIGALIHDAWIHRRRALTDSPEPNPEGSSE